MTPQDLLRSGDLDGAMEALTAQVRKAPADAKLRVFLFQLLCLRGEWKRAVQQLKVCVELDPAAEAMARTYREAIICEVFRERVFAGQKQPMVFGAPQEWMALLIEALSANAAGRAADAADLRARAFDAAPATPGMINDSPFAWIADADMRLGPMLEVVMNGKYYWMPFTAVSALRMDPPADLRDAVWTPAHLTLATGAEQVALIPTRYPGTVAAGDPLATLARATHWQDMGNDSFAGTGQRVLATDAGDVALMDVRSLVMSPPAAGQPADV
jgi:type VI secretion system protein ImpE